MKILRTFALLSILISILVISWNCSDDSNVTNSQKENIIQTDGPGSDHVSIDVLEYVRVTHPDNSYYEDYRRIDYFNCGSCFNPPSTNNSSFTTPISRIRTEGSDTVETLFFEFRDEIVRHCDYIYLAGSYYVQSVYSNTINSPVYYSTCYNPPYATYYNQNQTDVHTFSAYALNYNTSYNVQWGCHYLDQ